MRRSTLISLIAFLILASPFVVMMTGCNPDNTGNPAGGGSGGGAGGGSNTFQSQIDAAAAGSTVTLDSSYTGSSISISKALTVNGSGIQNLSITVNANVADDVALSNFVNATVTVASGSTAKMARRARDAGEPGDGNSDAEKPKDIGADNPKLRLENCSIEKITAYDDVTLYLDRDTRKVTVGELELKEGLEDFVLIGADKDDDATDKKSSIDKLSIEAGVEEINLIGARFEDVEFKGDFEDKVDLYFEKDVDERLELDVDAKQISDDFKTAVEEASEKVAAKDVCNVKNGSGVYKVSFPKDKIPDAKGAVFIMLLRDDQKTAYLSCVQEPVINTPGNGPGEHGWYWATKEHPYYDIRYTGAYIFSDGDGVHTVAGDTDGFYAYVPDGEDIDFDYENYLSYSKEALCTDCDGTDITLFVNMENLKKSDLNTCAYKEDGFEDEYYLTPNKLTEIDLEGYTPYIALDFLPYCINVNQGNYAYGDDELAAGRSFFGTSLNQWDIQVPVSKSNNYTDSFQYVFMFPMTEITAAEYPDVSEVEYDVYPNPNYNN